MRDMDKMTLNEMFGEKSAAFGEGARRLTEDELFTMAGFLLPAGRIKALKQAGSRGVKVVRDLIDELMGKGKKVSGEVPVAKDPFDLLPKKQDPGLTMKDILQGNQRAMDVPAFEREALGLTKRVRIPGRKQNVETGAKSVNEMLRIEAPKTGSEMLPSIQRQMVPRTFQQRQDAFIDDLLNRVYGTPSPRSMNPKAAEIFEDNLYALRNRVNRASTIGTPTIEQSLDDFRRAGQAFRRSNRVSPQQRVTKEIERNRNMIKNIGDSIGKDTGKGYKEVDIQDLIDFLSGKN
tara:strand:- start:99 stop:971 length:873 start_codon:yes stop_codon:yes gene_type:complete